MKYETRLEIDLKKVKYNTESLCKSYNDYKYKIACLKDNAYGMGLKIVNTLVNNGINYIMVGSLTDALEIRKYNSKIPILVNYYVDLEEIYDCINNNIAITIYNLSHLQKINELKIKDSLHMQILIDNGSNVLGVKDNLELKDIIDLIHDNNFFVLDGFYTDLTTLGVEDSFFYQQISAFYQIISNYLQDDLMIHLNEPCMYHTKLSYINGIRFDLSLIGIEENIDDGFLTNMRIKSILKKYGDLQFPNIDLQLIFNLVSEVMAIKYVTKGSIIGRNYIAKDDMLVAIVPIGHKDGITKAINYVGINKYKRNILTDEIDHIVVEIDKDVNVKDKVYIVNEERGIYDFLTLLKTNRYYLMSVLNRPLKRVYINEEENKEEGYL